jgi:transmembrane sensor
VKNNTNIEELLKKYVNNECSPEEIELVFEYLRTSQADAELHAVIDAELWEEISSHTKADEHLEAEMYKSIEHSISRIRPIIPVKSTASVFSYPIWKYAAVLTGILLSTVLGYYVYRWNTSSHLITHSTTYGQTATVVLPDSSVVKLNANSSITYSSDWSAKSPREVSLKGEAFFSVKHTINHQKFKVNTSDNFNVEVLGTEFNVYNRNAKTRVVLNSGKITLHMEESAKQKKVTMQPGEMVEFKDSPSGFVKRGVNAEVYSSWTNNKLILDNTSFRDIALLLEETYGLAVIVPDESLYEERFSGIVPCENEDMLLTALSLSFNLKVNKYKNQVKFQYQK